MDLWQLHILCKVIETKSFSKAAEAIRLSQPTVSSHIKDLEAHFGCRLIDRLSKQAVPTKAGELLYGFARKLISLRNEAETALFEFQGKIKGNLIIGGSTIPGGYILPAFIGVFSKKYPEVTVSLIIGDTRKVIDDTLSGKIEIGMVGAKTDQMGIIQEKVIEDEMRVIIPAGHRWAGKKSIPLKEVSREPFIVRESGSGTLTSIKQSLSEKGHHIESFNIVAEMGSTEAIIQGIKGNAGISILSSIAVDDNLKAGTLNALNIIDLDLKRNFYLTLHKSRSLSPLGRAFIDHLKGEMAG